jgi:hypothetical protein
MLHAIQEHLEFAYFRKAVSRIDNEILTSCYAGRLIKTAHLKKAAREGRLVDPQGVPEGHKSMTRWDILRVLQTVEGLAASFQFLYQSGSGPTVKQRLVLRTKSIRKVGVQREVTSGWLKSSIVAYFPGYVF